MDHTTAQLWLRVRVLAFICYCLRFVIAINLFSLLRSSCYTMGTVTFYLSRLRVWGTAQQATRTHAAEKEKEKKVDSNALKKLSTPEAEQLGCNEKKGRMREVQEQSGYKFRTIGKNRLNVPYI